jgi:hypothetical protein
MTLALCVHLSLGNHKQTCFLVQIANELCNWYKFWLISHKFFLSTSCNAYALNLPLRPVPVFANVLSLLQFNADLRAALRTCRSFPNSCFQILTTEWSALRLHIRQALHPNLGPESYYPDSSFVWYSSVSSSGTAQNRRDRIIVLLSLFATNHYATFKISEPKRKWQVKVR